LKSNLDTDFIPIESFPSSVEALSTMPPSIDDFVGRTFDVWAVIQHLERRKMVVVSAEQGSDHGMGLSAVCDSVTRYLQLRSFGNGSKLQNSMFQKVVRVYLNSLSDPYL
jgi:hypothetical protein